MNLRKLAALAFALATTGAISAETLTLRSNIPFSFVVNGTTLPAGEYTVRHETSPLSEPFVRILGADNGPRVLVMVTSEDCRPSSRGERGWSSTAMETSTSLSDLDIRRSRTRVPADAS